MLSLRQDKKSVVQEVRMVEAYDGSIVEEIRDTELKDTVTHTCFERTRYCERLRHKLKFQNVPWKFYHKKTGGETALTTHFIS